MIDLEVEVNLESFTGSLIDVVVQVKGFGGSIMKPTGGASFESSNDFI